MATNAIKKQFFCTACGAAQSKWFGKCPACSEWSTCSEEIVQKKDKKEESRVWREDARKAAPILMQNVQMGEQQRIETTDDELNRVLGGGIVGGSLILLGGEPGIGKSTLMLQVAMQLNLRILYVSGEESEEQIKMRAERIGIKNKECYLLTATDTSTIFQYFKEIQPQMLVIDSIQTIQSPLIDSTPGSISQVRECAGELQRLAKETNTPVFVIGHITKEGTIAGPKLLEHIVDVVLQFEGDRHYSYRILRTQKNRFGSTAEIGIYEMLSGGLRQVSNPSELLISQKDDDLSGSAICATLEGIRPMLIEAQALVSTAVYGTPQRSATGFDLRRLSMLLAVLEKRCGFMLGQKDVFMNIAGGIKVDDPAIDLAIVAAILSSIEDVCIDSKTCFAGEIGLSGEIRAVTRVEQRIQEADRLGFEKIFISKYNTKGLDLKKFRIEIVTVAKLEELYNALFV